MFLKKVFGIVSSLLPIVLLVAFCWCLNFASNHTIRSYAQDHEWAYHVLTTTDFITFVSGSSNPADNQLAWAFTRSLKEDHSDWIDVFVWDIGFSSLIQDEYSYRPHFDHDFPPDTF